MLNTIHATTRKSPSMLLFGVEQRGRVVDELTEFLEEKTSTEACNLEEIRFEALENIEKTQRYSQKYFLRHSAPAKEFDVGDFVVIDNIGTPVGLNRKLHERYRGPYVIKKKLPHDRYVVTDIGSHQVTQIPYDGVVESRRLRLWLMSDGSVISETQGDTFMI